MTGAPPAPAAARDLATAGPLPPVAAIDPQYLERMGDGASERRDALGQPIGRSLGDWTPPEAPEHAAWGGRWCRLEPLDPEAHAEELHDAYRLDTAGRLWTYLAYGPFASLSEYRPWVERYGRSRDPLFFAIRDGESGRAVGVASYLRIHPDRGSIEVGHICYSPLLQRRTAATEAMYLMMRRAFDLGYRRYEWKCDALNAPSRRAAERLGFRFEGIHRQAMVYKGRNRDTAWYSIVDGEWPALRAAYEDWLAPDNFDAAGAQRASLASFARAGDGP